MLQWLSDAWNGVTSIGRDAINAIVNVVMAVYGWASSAFTWTYTWIENVASDAANGIAAVSNALTLTFASLSNWVSSNLDKISSWVSELVQDAENLAASAVNSLSRWAEDAINGLKSAYDSVTGWVVSNVWDPLYGAIQAAASFIQNTIIPWVQGLVGDAVSFVQGLWNQLWNAVSDAVNFVEQIVKQAWPIIDKAWNWIVWFALHPLEDMQALIGSMFNFSPSSVLTSLEDALAHYGDEVEGIISKWFDV